MANPGEEKFRTIKKTNAAIQKKLLSLEGMELFLETVGFSLEGENLVYKGDDMCPLKWASATVTEKARLLQMTPEQREKEELIKKRNAEYKAQLKAKAQVEKDLAERNKLDRIEKSQEVVKDSKGNKLNFGANVVKF